MLAGFAFDAIIWTSRRRWEPLRHAAIRMPDGAHISLCGRVDQRLWLHATRQPYTLHVGSPWIHDPTCRECWGAIRRQRACRAATAPLASHG